MFSVLLAAFAAFAAACGDDNEGVSGAKPLSELSDSEITSLCEVLGSAGGAGDDTFEEAGCVLEWYFATQQGDETPCTDYVASCLEGGGDGGAGGDGGDDGDETPQVDCADPEVIEDARMRLMTCPEGKTVSDVRACTTAAEKQFANLGELLSCETLSDPDFDPSTLSSFGDLPSTCDGLECLGLAGEE